MRSNSRVHHASTSSQRTLPDGENPVFLPIQVQRCSLAIVLASVLSVNFFAGAHSANCDELDLSLSKSHPLVSWYQHKPSLGKIPNAKTYATPSGNQVAFSPLGNKGIAVTAGFDYRLASDGDFYFALECAFHIPKGEEGGSLVLSIPFNSPDEGRLSVRMVPSNTVERQVTCTAQYASKSAVPRSIEPIVVSASKGLIEVQRSGSKVLISFTPNQPKSSSNSPTKTEQIQSQSIEVPNSPIRPISLWMRCSPKSSVVKYDLLRFMARTDRSPASLAPTTSQTNWLTWCTLGFLTLGISAGAIKFFLRPKEHLK